MLPCWLRPVDDVAMDDAIPFLDHQRGRKRWLPSKNGSLLQQVGMHRLQAASCVARAVAEDGVAQPVGETRSACFSLVSLRFSRWPPAMPMAGPASTSASTSVSTYFGSF